MSSTPLHTQFDSIDALRRALQAREVNALDLPSSALDPAQAHADLNAFLHIARDLTLAQADAPTHERKRTRLNPIPSRTPSCLPRRPSDLWPVLPPNTTACSWFPRLSSHSCQARPYTPESTSSARCVVHGRPGKSAPATWRPVPWTPRRPTST